MPDNNIRAGQATKTVEYVKQRVHNYLGGVLEDECVELYRRYSEEEARLVMVGRR